MTTNTTVSKTRNNNTITIRTITKVLSSVWITFEVVVGLVETVFIIDDRVVHFIVVVVTHSGSNVFKFWISHFKCYKKENKYVVNIWWEDDLMSIWIK